MRLGLEVRFSGRGTEDELVYELKNWRITCTLYERKENRDHKHANDDPIMRYYHMQCFPYFPNAIATHLNHKT